jgi:hypothetical protein
MDYMILQVSGVAKLIYGPFYRIETDEEVAKSQVESREICGKVSRNFYQSPYPKVKAYTRWIGGETAKGIIFTTDVAPDANAPPGWALWSGERDGISLDGEYAKIKALEIDYYP